MIFLIYMNNMKYLNFICMLRCDPAMDLSMMNLIGIGYISLPITFQGKA